MNNFLFYIYYNITFIITKSSSARQFKIVLLNLLHGRKEKCKTIHLNCLGEMGWWQQDNLDCLGVCFMCGQDKHTLSFCHVLWLGRQSDCPTFPLARQSELSYLPSCKTIRIVLPSLLQDNQNCPTFPPTRQSDCLAEGCILSRQFNCPTEGMNCLPLCHNCLAPLELSFWKVLSLLGNPELSFCLVLCLEGNLELSSLAIQLSCPC